MKNTKNSDNTTSNNGRKVPITENKNRSENKTENKTQSKTENCNKNCNR
ncbi:MAG: hypothetical protein IKM61_08430 [Eubacteriaceae bacterium]|nr:hypothetical protein [Eubacteriaceae bacterium]